MSDFTDRMEAARKRLNINQKQLADRTGLHPSVISNFESGRQKPSFDNLKLLSNGLCVTADYLLGDASPLPAVRWEVKAADNNSSVAPVGKGWEPFTAYFVPHSGVHLMWRRKR